MLTKHNPIPPLSPKQISSFWKRVDVKAPDVCWEWKAHRNKSGYGRAALKKNQAAHMAHRIAYFLHYGTDPLEQCVCHHCDNPPCCNPSHFFLGGRRHNLEDMRKKGRYGYPKAAKGSRPNGERSAAAKLKDRDIPLIDQMTYDGITLRSIANHFGVSPGVIHAIRIRKTWTHIPKLKVPMGEVSKQVHRKPRFTKDEIEEVMRLTEAKKTLMFIGKAIGRNPISVCRIRKKITAHISRPVESEPANFAN